MEVKITEQDGRYLREMFAWWRSSERRRQHEPSKRGIIPNDKILVVKTTAAHSDGATQSCDVLSGGMKGSEQDSGRNISCYNGLGDLADDTRCLAAFIDGSWELIQARCSE